MKNITKLGATAAAIGALGVAGSFGTFSAFTDSSSVSPAISAGTLKVTNDFQLPELTNLGTRETTWNCNADGKPVDGGAKECFFGPDGKRAGHVTVTNTGSLPQDVYFDFDGPGAIERTSPNAEPNNPIANNLIVDTSTTEDFSAPGYAGYPLWKFNRNGPAKWFTLAKGESKTIWFRVHLRERFAGDRYPLGDNEMQGVKIDNQKLTIAAVEEGRDDLKIAPVASGEDAGKNYDYGL